MALTAGQKLGPYEILASIGAGGMGEVYRARDERLKREVAIKVLPAAYSADPERLRRFEQEAQAAGALNHPNITAVYDFGSHDGAPYIVTELLEGETLRSRLAGGAFTPRRAIGHALQIAQGLAAAHDKGIVHRDLKPENVFVTNDGRVKILDFGLAKLTQPEGAGSSATSLPTAAPGTEPGLVMGTVGYMSPEQVRGKFIDARSDIFSFGTILYEMLSGKRAFHGDTPADTMSAILTKEPPDLSETNRRVPDSLERIVRHCLEKSPEARFQSASDIAFNLEALSGASLTSEAQPGVTRGRRVPLIAAALALLAAGALLLVVGRRAPLPAPPPMRFTVGAPPGTSLNFGDSNFGGPPALSPDGRWLVFAATDAAGRTQLWLRGLDSIEPRLLPGTDNAIAPFWSPDSRWIGFFGGLSLKKIEVRGETVETICSSGLAFGGTWGKDGTILFAEAAGRLMRVPSAGGKPSAIGKDRPSDPNTGRFNPVFLPDGEHFLYLYLRNDAGVEGRNYGIFVASLSEPEGRRISKVTTSPAYASGFLFLVSNSRLLAQRFDTRRLQTEGEPVAIVDRVATDPTGSTGSFSISPSGLLAYQVARASATLSELAWFDRSGKRIGPISERRLYGGPRLSPDGRQVLVQVTESTTQYAIWLLDAAGGFEQRLTAAGSAWNAVWSRDGKRVAYSWFTEKPGSQVRIRDLVQGKDEILATADTYNWISAWTPDGDTILSTVVSTAGTPGYALRRLSFSERQWRPWAPGTTANEVDAILSPDGRWAAFGSDESGRYEIYVRPFPGPGEKWQVSRGAGTKAQWRGDGKELYYVSPDARMMAVGIAAAADRIEATPPVALFDAPLVKPLLFPADPFTVTGDGKRFLIVTPVGEIRTPPLTVVVNWPSLLRSDRP